jgi:hypothetical protein
VRVYLPAGPALLRELQETGRLAADPERTAYAVTPEVCAELGVGADDEEAEYAVLAVAAADAVALTGEVARRVVLVLETNGTAREGALVSVPHEVPLKRVEAVQADDADAEPLVRAARDGDSSATAALEDHDLGWFATQELGQVLEVLRG